MQLRDNVTKTAPDQNPNTATVDSAEQQSLPRRQLSARLRPMSANYSGPPAIILEKGERRTSREGKLINVDLDMFSTDGGKQEGRRK